MIFLNKTLALFLDRILRLGIAVNLKFQRSITEKSKFNLMHDLRRYIYIFIYIYIDIYII